MSELKKITQLPGPMAGCELPPDWLVDNFPDLKSGRVWFGVDPAGHAADAMAYAFAGFPRKSRLEQIIEEGLARMDKAVNRVCDRYKGMRDAHPWEAFIREIMRARHELMKASPSAYEPLFVWMTMGQYMDIVNASTVGMNFFDHRDLARMPPRFYGMAVKFHYDDYIRVS